MCKKYPINTNHFFCILLFLFFLYPPSAFANKQIQEESIITLPVQADLSVLEKYLNEYVPYDVAVLDERGKVCLKPQDIKVPFIPKCKIKGFKVSCKDWTRDFRTVPKIKCDVKGWVKRNGRILLSGNGSTLTFAFPVKAEASADGYIYGTARASAILYLNAKLHINNDWTISINITHDFAWSNSPELKLFDLFSIDIKKVIEPKLRKRLDKFAKRVPKLLRKLDIKGMMEEQWEDIQDPLKIDDDTDTYLLFQPHVASCSQIDIVDHVLRSTISARGKTQVLLGKPPVDYTKTKMTDLETICYKEGKFNFHLPVRITYEELLARSHNKYADVYTIDLVKSVVPGMLKVSNPKIGKSSDGRLSISAHISYDNRDEWLKTFDMYDWFDTDGEITFTGSPRIDKETRTLIFDDLVYDSTTNNDLFDLLIDTAELAPIQSYLEGLVKFDYGKKIDEGVVKANKSLNEVSQGDLKVTGRLEKATVEDITINEKDITITTELSGVLDANARL
ncbi:hypothetical protein TSL6_00440 [Sulfurovum sp. TSL6]|uniref:DUF4403 family protein n=1 Tax=Sulfurovum sp. TSL6 TaxID=2826995 RepID=UPI001CC6DEE0|nr:DUF4403 family protein [Sulfurovum sp. TSL6]GIT99537.1 hypothetical protein TSL6_00440 [Sulfurovum sp. TSL6]